MTGRPPPRRPLAPTNRARRPHEAIASVRDVVGKYYALLTQRSIGQWEPVPQYDTLAAFMQPWILDRAAVQRAIEEAGRT